MISLGEDKVVLSFPGEAGTARLQLQDFPLVAFQQIGAYLHVSQLSNRLRMPRPQHMRFVGKF